jgi:hypothetical protein
MQNNISIEALAARLNVSTRTIERRIKDGTGPVVTWCGSRRSISPHHAEEYVATLKRLAGHCPYVADAPQLVAA